MKNTLKIIAVCALSMFVTSAAFAGAAIGISAAVASVDASGNEKMRTSGSITNHSTSEDLTITSLFIEHSSDEGVTIGVELIPYGAEVGKGSNTGDDDLETSGTNSVAVNFENHITLYAEKTIGDLGLYVKGGISQVTLKTKDTISTGATYGDESMSGYVVGIGIKRDLTNGFFFKLAGEYASYDGATFNSSGSDDTNVVTLQELDVTQAKLSIGKSF